MNISLELIKQLRGKTSAGVSDCRRALEDAGGDLKKAAELLKKKGLEAAKKKSDRAAKQGLVASYVHHDHKTGVLLEVNCETDFVARNEDFRCFVKDLTIQIAATSPLYIKQEDVPKKELPRSKSKKDFLKTNCLIEQEFVKDPSMTIKDYLGSVIGKLGENIVIKRFIRYRVGE